MFRLTAVGDISTAVVSSGWWWEAGRGRGRRRGGGGVLGVVYDFTSALHHMLLLFVVHFE